MRAVFTSSVRPRRENPSWRQKSRGRCGAEIVSADAFQIYRGLDLLTAKPDSQTSAKAPHHLLSAIPLSEEMNAQRFRTLALDVIEKINARGKPAIVVGGSGLYIKALHARIDAFAGCQSQTTRTTESIERRRIARTSQNTRSETAGTIDEKIRDD